MARLFALLLGAALALSNCGEQKRGGLDKDALADPQSEKMNRQAPDRFKVGFETSAGNFVIAVERDPAPRGADRFYNLVMNGFYDEQRFFRVVPDFVVQFGIHGDPEIAARWRNARIEDDLVEIGNGRGTIAFAKSSQPHSRTTQVFINYKDNQRLDDMGFATFGSVVEGMEVVDAINSQYGQDPDQGQIQRRGNAYLSENYPELDYILQARVID